MIKTRPMVLKRLLERKQGKKDKHKLALIIEGGGMRGSFSGGAMMALEKLGLSDVFDYLYASSSGSCGGAFLLSHQTDLGTSIYVEDLSGFKFIKPWKLNRAADIDYLCDVVFRQKKKLDVKKVVKSKTIFKVFVADANNGKCSYYTNKDKVDLIEVIKASCALPAFYNKPVKIGSNKHMDGRIEKAIPIENAISDGCTDVLIVTTVPEDFYEFQDAFPASWVKRLFMSNLPKQYREKYLNIEKHNNYNESLDVAFGRMKIHRKINIYTISPNYLLNKYETSAKVLREAIDHGYTKTIDIFTLEKKTDKGL